MIEDVDRRFALTGLVSLLLPVPRALAAAPKGEGAKFPVRINDLMVMDARTQTRFHLFRDLIRDRVAVINFMFVGCSTICPMQSSILARAQKLLAPELGRQILFASVSISPLSDTPAKLVQFADAHGSGAGWHFLRGGIRETQKLQEGFDSFAPIRDDHPPVFCIGRASADRWTRLYGMPKPDQVAREARNWLRSA